MLRVSRIRVYLTLLSLLSLGTSQLIHSPQSDPFARPPEKAATPVLAPALPLQLQLAPPPPPKVLGEKEPTRPRRNPEPLFDLPDLADATTILHTVKRGESVGSMAYRYLPQSLFLTSRELEFAIRQFNPGLSARTLHPGQQWVIPGIETAPIEERPRHTPKDAEVRAIYLTGLMAGHARGIELIRRWRELGGNAIVFDVKDMDGSVSVGFEHPLAPKTRRPNIHSLPKFTRFLHRLGLHAIARIALFRDEQVAHRFPELAVRSRRTGGPWRENGKPVWADPSRRAVQDYNLALARHVATSGVDEIQFDYVRFPAEGDQADAEFHFQSEPPPWRRSQVITDFLERAYAELRPLGVLVSLDVFGVMAWQRPVDLAHTGQDIAAMARFCDVLSPMIYPSHFFGMDGYAKPGDAPEHFIGVSMKRFREITADTDIVLRPWLQAFAWRTKTYSPGYIHTQINVARQEGGIGYLFWNARNDYSAPFLALSRTPPPPPARSPDAPVPSASGDTSPPTPPPAEPAPPARGESVFEPTAASPTASRTAPEPGASH